MPSETATYIIIAIYQLFETILRGDFVIGRMHFEAFSFNRNIILTYILRFSFACFLMCIWWLSNFIFKIPFFDKKWNFYMVIVNEYTHLQRHNRFHFSFFHRLFILVIRHSPRIKRVRSKKDVFFHLFFELYFEHVRMLKCVFN